MSQKIFIVIGVLILVLGLLFYLSKKQSVEVSVVRTFNAPVDKVWKVWIDPETMKKWWSPKTYTAPVIKSDFRVGGSYLFSMKSPSGKLSWNTGKYVEIIPQKKIVMTMSFSDENGNVVPAATYGLPGEWPTEVKVIAEFKETGGKTQVVIQEVGIPMMIYVFAKLGWEQQFDKFEALLN